MFDGEGKYLYIRICPARHGAINIGFTRERASYMCNMYVIIYVTSIPWIT